MGKGKRATRKGKPDVVIEGGLSALAGEVAAMGKEDKRDMVMAGGLSVLAGQTARPRIDKSQLPPYLWPKKDVQEMERDLQDYLMQPGVIEDLSIHEGGHLFYKRKIHPNPKLIPPSFTYDELGRYGTVTAAVECKDIDFKCDQDRLLTFAKSAAAGGAVLLIERALTTDMNQESLKQLLSRECGDSDDRNKFPLLCKNIRDATPGLIFEDDFLWKQALVSIAVDCFTTEIRSALDATIAEVRTSLWKSMYGDQLSSDTSKNHGSPTNISK